MIYVLINHICYESKWKNSALNRYGLKVLPLLSDFHFFLKNKSNLKYFKNFLVSIFRMLLKIKGEFL
jgi:hypothetical protein